MFFISWGKKGAWRYFGSAGFRHCAHCGQDGEFQALLTYVIHHVWWIFRWVTDKKYFVECPHCSAKYTAEAKDFDQQVVSAAIPKWDRLGWVAGPAILGSLITVGMVANAAQSSATQGYIAAPHVGDIYEVNMAKLEPDQYPGGAWTAMRVAEVEGDDISVVLAKTGYSQLQGVQKDVENIHPPVANYYSDHVNHTNKHALAAMLKNGVIERAIRP